MAVPLRRPQNLMGYGEAQVFQPSGESPFFDEYSRQKQLGQRDRSLDIQEGNVAQQQRANAAKIERQNENIKYDYLKGLSQIKGNVSPYIRSKLSEARDDIWESASEVDPSELKRSILKLNDQINIYNTLDDEMVKRATSVAEGKLYPSWMSNGVLNNNPDVNEDAFDNLVADMDIDQALGTLSGVVSGGFAPNVNPVKRYTEFFNDELSSVILNDPQIPAKTRREQIAGTNNVYEQDYKTLSPEQAFGYFDGFLGADKESQSFIGMMVLNNLHDRGINVPTKEQVDEETQNVLNSMDIPTTVYGKQRSGTIPQDKGDGNEQEQVEVVYDKVYSAPTPDGDITFNAVESISLGGGNQKKRLSGDWQSKAAFVGNVPSGDVNESPSIDPKYKMSDIIMPIDLVKLDENDKNLSQAPKKGIYAMVQMKDTEGNLTDGWKYVVIPAEGNESFLKKNYPKQYNTFTGGAKKEKALTTAERMRQAANKGK